MQTNVGISDTHRQQVAERLNVLLSDNWVMYAKARNFHWNVRGPQFGDLHAFFEKIYEQMDEEMDSVAERVRALGFDALGSLTEYAQRTRMTEATGKRKNAREMLGELLTDQESLIRTLRADANFASENGDEGTAGFLASLMEGHEKTAWMLRSYLED